MPRAGTGPGSTDRRRTLVLALILAAMTVAAYAQVHNLPFIPGDDRAYVSKNPVVLQGVTAKGLWWALTSLDNANWHPVTWVSHMLDVQLFGPAPGRHHLVNAAFHVLDAVLLLALLARLTGAVWRGALVAAVFALHPLRVESVAWVAERKDLLSGAFFLLTVAAYLWHVRRPGERSFHWVTASFALGLMSKPMLVTVPALLLLLDHWPLGRASTRGRTAEYLASLRPLVREKLPLLALSVLDALLTLAAQARGGAVASLGAADAADRLGNALTSYVAYLGKALWPAGLAAFYPYPQDGIPWQRVVGAAVLLAAACGLAFRERQRRPWLLIGWLWFLGMLVPVLGFVQVGGQARADRYTYLPLIGVLVAATWSVPGPHLRRHVAAALLLAAAGLGALAGMTEAQVRYWRDGVTLYRHALAVNARDPLSHFRIGQILAEEGKFDEALSHLRESVRLARDGARQAYATGLFLEDLGRGGDAVAFLEEALRIEPRYPLAHFMAGLIQAKHGAFPEAAAHLREAIAQDPGFAEARYQLGVVLAQAGDLQGAVDNLSAPSVLSSPLAAQAHYNLGVVLEQLGRREDAEAHFRAAGGRR